MFPIGYSIYADKLLAISKNAFKKHGTCFIMMIQLHNLGSWGFCVNILCQVSVVVYLAPFKTIFLLYTHLNSTLHHVTRVSNSQYTIFHIIQTENVQEDMQIYTSADLSDKTESATSFAFQVLLSLDFMIWKFGGPIWIKKIKSWSLE